MKIRGLLALLLSVAVMSSCEGLQDIISGAFPDTEDTGNTGDTGNTDEGNTDEGNTDEGNTGGGTDEQGTVTIASITTDGTYKVQGTVVAVGNDAYILADDTAPILVYGSNHGRTLMEVVKAEGSVYRYKGYDTDVLQMKTTSVEVVSTGAQWEYSPTRLDAGAFDALVGKKATCADITFEGTLTIDGTYVNVRPDGAGRTSSFKYVSVSDYTSLDGQKVVVGAFVTGTYNYLYMLPYKVEVKQSGLPEGCVWISSVTSDGNYTVQGTVVAAGNSAYVVADASGALMVYGYGHGRSLGDVVKLTGAVSRYRSDVKNVFQMSNAEAELIRTGDSWSYNPEQLDQYDINALVGGTATCSEVAVTGVLQRSGNYLNFNVEGASHQVSFYYVDTSQYSDISDGATVEMKGYIVGTGGYLKIIPYSVTVVSGPSDDPDVPSDSDPTTKKWMELPAMNTAGLDYYCHSFSMNGKTYRNYSFGWDDNNKVAYWVAYPLCRMYTDGDAGRQGDYFIKDPLLGDASPRPGSGYAGAYDRGHQIPSADRQCSELANGQTYYGTNMTGQSNSLNGGPWAELEGEIRNFANSTDTTYVVTGCYVRDSNEWSTDSDGMSIKIPTAYFKAVLVLKNGNWTGGAYWTPHVGYSSSYTDWAISIDELEQKTGLDLYVNLPEKIGESAAAEIEAAKSGDAKWWN